MKKLLCLILTLAVVLTSFSFCLTAFAAENSASRSASAVSAVEKVLNPILASDRDKEKTTYYSEDTLFADSIEEIGYDSIDNLTTSLTKENFDNFIKVNADDEMLGIDYDFLYSKNSGLPKQSRCFLALKSSLLGAQTERGTLGLLALAHVCLAATHLNGVQGAVTVAVISAAVDGTLNALVDILHNKTLL